MPYTDFSLSKAVDRFALQVEVAPLFQKITPRPPSAVLLENLSDGLPLALRGGSEKARSEFIIAPILMAVRRLHQQITIYSGVRFDVDAADDLIGEVDFLVAEGLALPILLQPPILALVEAKKQDIEVGIGQCVAQMVAAWRFNMQKNTRQNKIYGCVTTGENWQFLCLEQSNLTLDLERYTLSPTDYPITVATLLGVFDAVLQQKEEG
jgi:hypothetical protein